MIFDEWIRDIPVQFQNKPNIEIFIKAFSHQLDMVGKAIKDTNDLTTVSTARGVNLDAIGNILSLTRKQAHIILKTKADEEVEDDSYRNALRFWAIRNNTDITYADIMNGISQIWDIEPIEYIEPENRPATIQLKLPTMDFDEEDIYSSKRKAVFKPSGVQLLWWMLYITSVESKEQYWHHRLKIHFIINPWQGRYIDDTWYLDGTVPLVGEQHCIRLPIHIRFRFVAGKLIDNTWLIDGKVPIQGLTPGDKEHYYYVGYKERYKFKDVSEVTVRRVTILFHNYYFIDNSWLLGSGINIGDVIGDTERYHKHYSRIRGRLNTQLESKEIYDNSKVIIEGLKINATWNLSDDKFLKYTRKEEVL